MRQHSLPIRGTKAGASCPNHVGLFSTRITVCLPRSHSNSLQAPKSTEDQSCQSIPHGEVDRLNHIIKTRMSSSILPTLESLPNEIHHEIISMLDAFDKLILRTMNQHFREMIPATTENLLATEQADKAIMRNLLGCFDCRCLRRAVHFADNMCKGPRRVGGIRSSSRFCIDCGLKGGPGKTRYTRGSIVTVGGKRFIKCWCERFAQVAEDSEVEGQLLCVLCWEPIARRRKMRDQERAKAARSQAKKEYYALMRDLGRAESEIEDYLPDDLRSDEDDYAWSVGSV
ncbi:Putative F-box domain-containing protein [Colletotrichum destructivum]|uniref:F-box domain-containing protein n=1 Tax=Colletotrichum destructivum TaxID=34406 RepID=A0AAX4I1M9_9PEZI|nr:Putative F-box domain-containing protein [Colletotrichum destructivum]